MTTNPVFLKSVVPDRVSGQQHVLRLVCEPIPTVRVALVGLGARGIRALKRLQQLDHTKLAVICDVSKANVSQGTKYLSSRQSARMNIFQGVDAWKQVCEHPDIDLVYICTDWMSHTPMAVYAMQCGKHVCVEVPAATSVAECWQLVDAAELSRRHCMMLENCCYDVFELTIMNMVQRHLLGEIVHLEGAYIHDLRERLFSTQPNGTIHWQLQYALEHTGNPYPTHGLGPLCQILGIHRNDHLSHLVSMSSDQMGLTDYAERKFGKNSPEASKPYFLGDMNTTLIRTGKGKTIVLQHDIVNPRPYEKAFSINGTKGFVRKCPSPVISIESGAGKLLSSKKIKQLFEECRHPYVQLWGDKARKLCGERARDFIMDARLMHCLHSGLPLDMDVYDAAEWSCVTELSERSVLNGSVPIAIPDFTRGDWKLFHV